MTDSEVFVQSKKKQRNDCNRTDCGFLSKPIISVGDLDPEPDPPELDLDPDPDPLVRGTDPGIRICSKNATNPITANNNHVHADMKNSQRFNFFWFCGLSLSRVRSNMALQIPDFASSDLSGETL
jgi:hypothetical protein